MPPKAPRSEGREIEVAIAPLRESREAWRYRLASLLALLAVWEVAGRVWGSNLTVPPVSLVGVSLAALVVTPDVWVALATTLWALAIGFGAAIVTGIPLGLLLGWYPAVHRFLAIYIRGLFSLPVSSSVPILVVVFGINRTAQAAVIFLFCFPVLVINAALGVRGVEPHLVEMARSFGAGDLVIFRRVVLPSAVPAIFAGLRLGSGRAAIGMVVAELILLASGIGRLITRYSESFQAGPLFAVVVLVLAVGVGLIAFWQALERHLLRWRE